MANEHINKERHNLWFNLDKPYQKEAHEYLKLLGKSQTEMISLLIHNMLTQNGVTDVSTLSKDEAKKMRPSSVDNVNALVDIIVKAVNNSSSNSSPESQNSIKKAVTEKSMKQTEPVIIDEDEDEDDTEIAGSEGINDSLLKGLMGM